MLVDEPPHERGQLLAVVGKTQTCLLLTLFRQQEELVRIRVDATDADEGVLALALRAPLTTGIRQPHNEALDGALVLEQRVRLQLARPEVRLDFVQVVRIGGLCRAGLDGRVQGLRL